MNSAIYPLQSAAHAPIEDKGLLERLKLAGRAALLYFEDPSCLSCSLVGPVVDDLEERLSSRIDVYRLHIEDYPETARALHVISAPAVICIVGGEKYIVRTSPKEEIVSKVGSLLQSDMTT